MLVGAFRRGILAFFRSDLLVPLPTQQTYEGFTVHIVPVNQFCGGQAVECSLNLIFANVFKREHPTFDNRGQRRFMT